MAIGTCLAFGLVGVSVAGCTHEVKGERSKEFDPPETPPWEPPRRPPRMDVPLEPCPAGTERYGSEDTIEVMVPASPGITERHLGLPFKKDFRAYRATGGEAVPSVFLDPEDHVETQPLNTFRTDVYEVRTARQLDAHVNVFFVEAGVDSARANNHAVYRAEITDRREFIDDIQAGFRPLAELPEDARWYLYAVEYGNSYFATLSGRASSFGANVGVRLGSFGGGLSSFAEHESLHISYFHRGLRPKPGASALFAESLDEVEEAFTLDGGAVTTNLVFRNIPDVCVEEDEVLDWPDLIKTRVEFTEIEVFEEGGPGDPTWLLEFTCSADGNWLRTDARASFQDLPMVEEGFTYGLPAPLVLNQGLLHGQELTCGIGGENTGGEPIAHERFTVEVDPMGQPERLVEGTLRGTTERTDYAVRYRVRFEGPTLE